MEKRQLPNEIQFWRSKQKSSGVQVDHICLITGVPVDF